MSNTASLDDVVVHSDFDVRDKCDICGMRAWLRAIYVLVSFFFLNVFSAPLASASDYSASITTSGDVTLNVLNGNTSIEESSINVTTNCKAGYDLTLKSTVDDNNLYLDGDSSNNSAGTYIAPGDGTSTLGNSSSRWGYFISSSSTIPTTSSVFLPVPTALQTAASLKTIAETVSETDINDSFKIYYGVNAGMGLGAGSYTMVPESSEIDAPRGGLAYYLTVNPSCTTSLEISFNKNLDGEGGETGDEIISNFPTSNDNTIDTVNNAVILSTKRPTREGYTFKEWNTEPDGSGDYFRVGETIPLGVGSLSGFVTLYAIWVEDCPSATICYDGNHADAGAMNPQSFNAGTTTNLIASNFSRSGYGFTGWNTEADGTGTQYGPNQNFTMPSTGGVNLYAQWLAPSGTLQSFSSSNVASNMNTGDVLALEDDRDGEVYMVAKLADGNIWITENLRLLPNTATITNRNTNHPTNDFISDAPSSSSSTSQCSGDNATCVNQINYNAHNLDRTLTPAYDGSTNSTYWYSYGVMYNWYTATAGNGTYELTSSSAVGDLCPAGWHLPSGGANGEWGVLASNMPGNNGTAKSASLRSYPNNFLYSGDYNPSKDIPDGVGKQGRIWSTTPVSSNIKNAYRMGYNSTEVTAATSNSWNKWDNFAIRCIYQGGNVLYSDVEVDFEGTGITSLTFTSQG